MTCGGKIIIYISNYTIAIACLCLNASEYRVYMHHFYIFFPTKKIFKKFLFFSDTEYIKLLSESYEYEYEQYPDQDNYGSNKAQDTKTTSIGSTKKTSIRSNTHPTTQIQSTEENEQTSHATEMFTAESTKHYLR